MTCFLQQNNGAGMVTACCTRADDAKDVVFTHTPDVGQHISCVVTVFAFAS